ncbi:MAG: energy transducer TonB [Rufibacter sp.]
MNGKLIEGKCFDSNGVEVAYYPFQVKPEFPGGQPAMTRFLYKKLNKLFMAPYPKGSEAIISFIVNAEGKVEDVRVIKATNEYISQMGIKAVKSMPAWSPGLQDGDRVPVKYTVPFRMKETR